MIRKQDKTHVRTPAALERKYRFDKNFAETKQAGAQAQKAAEQAQKAADDIGPELANKVGRNENETVVNMVNASGKPVTAEFDQVNGEHRTHIKDGVIYVTSPEETMTGGDTNESRLLLLVFTQGEKKFGLYVHGEYFPVDPDDANSGIYWQPSGQIIVEEITE